MHFLIFFYLALYKLKTDKTQNTLMYKLNVRGFRKYSLK